MKKKTQKEKKDNKIWILAGAWIALLTLAGILVIFFAVPAIPDENNDNNNETPEPNGNETPAPVNGNNAGLCEVNELIYYYADWCGFCQQVEREGSLETLKEYGVEVKKVDIDTGAIEHEIRGVPAFVIEGGVVAGYRSLEQLKQLLGC